MLFGARAALILLLPLSAAAQPLRTVTIATGDTRGLYHAPIGTTLCAWMNEGSETPRYHCQLQPTGGSADNARGVSEKRFDFGLAQADVLDGAFRGREPFSRKLDNLRAVAALHAELLTFIVRKGAGIGGLKDLAGKRLNLGNPGSGQARTTAELLRACKVPTASLGLAAAMKIGEVADALKNQRLDGYFYVAGHPAPLIESVAQATQISFVGLRGACIEELLRLHPYYFPAAIPGGLYPGLEGETATIGVKAVLVTRAEESDETVAALVRLLLERLEELKNLHASLRPLTKADLSSGLTVPLHPSAARYLAR